MALRIKTPKFLRPIFGQNMADELGTGIGFGLGGPLGAAAGGAAGTLAGGGGFGEALKNAAGSYALGTGAQSLMGPTTQAGSVYGGALGPEAAGGAGGAPVSGAGRPSIGKALQSVARGPGRVMDLLSDPQRGTGRLQAAALGASTLADVYAAREQGRAEDEEEERRERSRRYMQPQMDTFYRNIGGR